MAVNPLTLRIAFMLTVAGWRAVQGPAVATWTNTYNALRTRLHDPNESDEDLSQALSDLDGYDWSVATYTGAFELRKLHLQFSQADAAVPSDDVRVTTFHFAKISGGSVVDTWDGDDFTALAAAVDAMWANLKTVYPTETVLNRIKVYKDGPAIEPPQVPVYDASRSVAGTSTDNPLPPQVAISVTEIAGAKPNWGRFYLPSPSDTVLSTFGRLASAQHTAIANYCETFYESMKAAGLHPVVYRQALPSRQKKNGATLAARDASAWDVEKIQIDDVFDVIRSRRFKYPTLRVQREIV